MNVMAKRDAPARPDLNNPELNNLAMSKEAQPLFDAVMKHIEENVAPITEKFFKLGEGRKDAWSWAPGQLELLEGAKNKAKKSGLWNFFLPGSEIGRGLTNLDYSYIAAELGKHKSWVSRRLLLAEQLTEAVQTQVRLGLVAPRTAMVLAALPRGNQKAAADIVTARALTVRQTELLVADVLDSRGSEQLTQRLAQWKEEGPRVASVKKPPPAKLRSEADWMCLDITTLRATGARLEARLLGTPLSTLGQGPSSIIRRGLEGLAPVLDALAKTLAEVMHEATPPKGDAEDEVA